MSTDPRKRISNEFLEDAPGHAGCVDQRLLNGDYTKSILIATRCKENQLTENDRLFIRYKLHDYADLLLERNFWNLAQLSKRRALHEIDPHLANEVYRICLNIDELKAILYFDSAREDR